MRNILLILSFSHLFLFIQAQDLIIKTKQTTETINCKIISYKDNVIAYRTIEKGELKYINTDEIIKCNFNSLEDEIIIPLIVFDTLKCTIDSITNDKVYYHTNENRLQNQAISKSEVFSCHFKDNKSHDKILAYKEKVHKSFIDNCQRKVNKLVKKNGDTINVKILSIDGEKINIELIVNNTKVSSFIIRSDVNSYIFNDFSNKFVLKHKLDYILKQDGNLIEYEIKKMDNNKIYINLLSNDGVVIPTFIDKANICGVFFSNFESDKALQTIKYEGKRKVEFNIKTGSGVLLAMFKDNIPDPLLDYTKKLRTGFNFDANLNYYIDYYSGIGLTYKFFKTSNTADQLGATINGINVNSAEDNISINFYGINYIYSTSPDNWLVYDFTVAPGVFTYKNKATVNNNKFDITGFNFGLNITNRVSIYNSNGKGLFLDFSILVGNLKEYTIGYQKIKLNDPDNISRIDIGIGIKLN